MVEDFAIDDLSGHLRASKNKDYQNRARFRFKNIISFLEKNSLLAPNSILDSANIVDETRIMKSDLTDKGFMLMQVAYRKWLQSIDRGKDPSDVSLLERELKKINQS